MRPALAALLKACGLGRKIVLRRILRRTRTLFSMIERVDIWHQSVSEL